MFTQNFLSSLIFIDIETVSGTKNLSELSQSMIDLWSERCEYLRDRFEDNKDLNDQDLYEYKSALHAEFNKIVCVSIGRLTFNPDGPKFTVKSFYGDDEHDIISKTLMGLDQLFSKNPGLKLCGHNVKNFDFPVLCKRAIINGISIPKPFIVHDKKPWEMPLYDTMDIWSFGAWQQGFTGLKAICTVLGLPSPKSDIEGKDVTKVYWSEKPGELERIMEYCERDTVALGRILCHLGDLGTIEDHNVVSKTKEIA